MKRGELTQKSHLNIKSQHDQDFSDTFAVARETYTAQTEDLGTASCTIATRIYRQGEVVYTANTDYSHLLQTDDLEGKLRLLMENQHKTAIDTFSNNRARNRKTKAEYAEELKRLLQDDDHKAALGCVEEALRYFPSDLFFLSHWGFLVAVVKKRPGEGAKICEEAIKMLRKSVSDDMQFFYPVFYLNLGRVYLHSGRKRAALKSFAEGLKFDSGNSDLLSEVADMGERRRPLLSFLDRGNPINKYLGRFRTSLQKKK
jgi:tetratricopeptide (TPR) repeat protein